MIRELLESLKYVGHYFAVCFLRVYTGIHILNLGMSKYYSHYLEQPILPSQIREFLRFGETPAGVEYFYFKMVIPYWSYFANIQVTFEILAGCLLIIGFLVRPVAFIMLVYLWFFSYIQDQMLWAWFGLLSATLFGLGWAGAGRCLGVDYYFYKRYRGFLW